MVEEEEDPLSRTELTFLLGLAFQLVVGEFVGRLDRLGYDDLRPVHGTVFQALRARGATSTELSQRLGVTKQAAGQMVDDLERLGYVRREAHPEGGRRRLVTLTAKGREHLAVAGRTMHALERELASDLGGPALAELRTQLTRVVRSLAGSDVPPLRPVW